MVIFLLSIVAVFYIISIVIGFTAGVISGIKDLPANRGTVGKETINKVKLTKDDINV